MTVGAAHALGSLDVEDPAAALQLCKQHPTWRQTGWRWSRTLREHNGCMGSISVRQLATRGNGAGVRACRGVRQITLMSWRRGDER